MKPRDIKTILYLITRPLMFVRNESEETFTAFLLGYQLGTEDECRLSEAISKLLFTQYKIKKQATGWPGQITEYANKYKLSWSTAFKKIVLYYIYQTEDFKKESELKNILKTRIQAKINQIDLDWTNSSFDLWHEEWFALVNINEKSFQHLWLKEELEIIIALDIEIKQIRNTNFSSFNKLFELKKYFSKTYAK